MFPIADKGARFSDNSKARFTLCPIPLLVFKRGGKVGSDKALVGAAGEHLVLSRLLSRGLLASSAPRGTEKVDIIVSDREGKSSFRIQVKTTEGSSDKGWFLSAKHEAQSEPDLFFCLVVLRPTEPEVFVVPSDVVAAAIHSDHRHWLSKPSLNGKQHKDSNMRRIRSAMPLMPDGWINEYREAWHLLTFNSETK